MTEKIEEIEILFVGEKSAGKTSIINRFVYNIFEKDLSNSCGISFFEKTTKFSNKSAIKIKCVDLAGSCEKNMMDLRIKTSSAIVLVYQKKSFHEDTNKEWLEAIREKLIGNQIIALVLNKIDLLKEEKDEFIENEKKFASEQNILFFTTSAAKNEGITELYEGLINKIKNWKDVKLVVEKQEEEEVGETEKEIEEKKEENLIVEDKKADSKKNDKKCNCPCF